ncbi:hypothetical protein DAPPUDRAFT_248498 [Daphnia pulex]|uniref:Uncharacterized protein n=1 Tax=Daphnia pulex TaxID=6669 RepID=E9GUS3_DAPPU|nr:hypothetical protein DAPPUDRAFT_248498 [Daphnia pulex]|eukprot:EFX76787.1 hypothetical protein DAPPUDRAFT_248498 [Daphnia pulex]
MAGLREQQKNCPRIKIKVEKEEIDDAIISKKDIAIFKELAVKHEKGLSLVEKNETDNANARNK